MPLRDRTLNSKQLRFKNNKEVNNVNLELTPLNEADLGKAFLKIKSTLL